MWEVMCLKAVCVTSSESGRFGHSEFGVPSLTEFEPVVLDRALSFKRFLRRISIEQS
jgi:hypothetical protein